METDECDYLELEKGSSYCRFFTGNIFSNGDIIHCKKHCSFFDCKKDMESVSEIDVGKCHE